MDDLLLRMLFTFANIALIGGGAAFGLSRMLNRTNRRDPRLARLEQEQRRLEAALLPPPRPRRMRDHLDPAMDEPAVLVAFQRAWTQLHEARPGVASPGPNLTDGAREALGLGPPFDRIAEAQPGLPRLRALSRSEVWRGLEVEITGVALEVRGADVTAFELRERWRLRHPATEPWPSDPFGPAGFAWVALVDRERRRLDLLAPALSPWAEPGEAPDTEHTLDADEQAALPGLLAQLLIAPDAVAAPPLRTGLERGRDALQGWTRHAQDPVIERITPLDRWSDAGWTHLEVEVLATARRWIEDAAGTVCAGDRDRPVRGSFRVIFGRAAGGAWAPWSISG